MGKLTVVILQENAVLKEELKKTLEEDDTFQVIGETNDGVNGINIIKELNPDFLIADTILPGIDGFWVIEKLKEQKIPVKTVLLSKYYREDEIERAMATGVNYFMVKPFNFQLLKERMVEMMDSEKVDSFKQKGSLEERISKIFINVGIPPHIKGYCYLREGVKMAVNNPDIINNITKKLYPKIGEKYETTASKVERAIRHAIEVAWNRGRIENINNILGVKAYVGAEKPTNGEFIALVADRMLLEQAK